MSWRPEWLWAPVSLIWIIALCVPSVRGAVADGWRCVRRHPILWKMPAAFMLAHGIFELCWGWLFHWFSETPFPLYLPWLEQAPSLPETALLSLPDAAEVLASNLNCLMAPFPLSLVGALALLVNYRHLTGELGKTLRHRLGWWGVAFIALLLFCLLAELAKPAMLIAGPQVLRALTFRDYIMIYTVVNALSFTFEYLLGTCLFLYLLLVAYSWVRGLQFDTERLLPFAVRRLGLVIRWALVIIGASWLVIFLPLFLESWLAKEPGAWGITTFVDYVGQPLLAIAMLGLATVPIHLALHNDTLREAIAGHVAFLRHSAAVCFLFLLAAFAALLVLKTIESTGEIYLGESLAGAVWKALAQTVVAAFSGWMLSAWVCFYTSRQRGARHPTF